MAKIAILGFGTVGSGSSNGGLFGWLWSLMGLQ